jgi:hypothetical protein
MKHDEDVKKKASTPQQGGEARITTTVDGSSLADLPPRESKENFPSIDLGYDIAVSSLDTSLKRLDFIDTKNMSLMTFGLSMFVVIPTVGNALHVPFNSGFLLASFVFLAVSVALTIIATKRGQIWLPDPESLFKDYLDEDEFTFKKDFIYRAGESWQSARGLIEHKWQLNFVSLIGFSLALFSAGLWFALNLP